MILAASAGGLGGSGCRAGWGLISFGNAAGACPSRPWLA
jgi:hypothetical protein